MEEIYDIYHDESKEESYWHGFLFIPRSQRNYILGLLNEARQNTKYFNEISYKKIKSYTKWNHETGIIIHSWTSIGVALLQQQKLLKLPIPIYLGGKPNNQKKYQLLDKLARCRFVIFKERDKHKRMFSSMTELECIETTFRMGIASGVHRLFNSEDPIKIGNVFIDGDEQYIGQFGRTFDVNRSLKRFAMQSRNYVSFTINSDIIPQKSNHSKIEKNQSINDSYLLQLCDILIGGIRFHSYCSDSKNIKYKISETCKYLLEHDQENIIRMKESRFYNGFLLNQAWIEDGIWKFCQLNTGEDKVFNKIKQLKLF